MNAGTAVVDITPATGTALAGYFHQRRATAVHDPLLVKALVLESGENAVAIVACDLIALTRDTVQRLRKTAEIQCGICAQDIMVACTHTHLGPATIDAFETSADHAALDRTVEAASQALLEAKSALQPVILRMSRAQLHGVAFNRRYRMADGTVRTNPGVRPDIIGPVGPVDPDVIVLSLTRDAGDPIAVIVSFALHLDTIGGDVVSADYPAFMSALIQAELGEQVVPMFLNAACGDVNHINFVSPCHPIQGFERAQAIGEALGRKVLQLLPEGKSVPPRIRAGSQTLRLDIRTIAPDEVAKAQEVLAAAPAPTSMTMEQMWARETVEVSRLPRSVEVEIQGLLLGDCALVGIPCEVFAELGLEIKQRSPFPMTGVVELANGCEGYLPTRRAYDEGSYEVTPARSSKLAPGSGEAVVEAAVNVLHSLSAD